MEHSLHHLRLGGGLEDDLEQTSLLTDWDGRDHDKTHIFRLQNLRLGCGLLGSGFLLGLGRLPGEEVLVLRVVLHGVLQVPLEQHEQGGEAVSLSSRVREINRLIEGRKDYKILGYEQTTYPVWE